MSAGEESAAATAASPGAPDDAFQQLAEFLRTWTWQCRAGAREREAADAREKVAKKEEELRALRLRRTEVEVQEQTALSQQDLGLRSNGFEALRGDIARLLEADVSEAHAGVSGRWEGEDVDNMEEVEEVEEVQAGKLSEELRIARQRVAELAPEGCWRAAREKNDVEAAECKAALVGLQAEKERLLQEAKSLAEIVRAEREVTAGMERSSSTIARLVISLAAVSRHEELQSTV